MHFACGEIDVRGLWCEIEKLIIFSRFRPNRVRNRRKVDHSGSNALVHASVNVFGVDFENANRPHSSQHLPAPLSMFLQSYENLSVVLRVVVNHWLADREPLPREYLSNIIGEHKCTETCNAHERPRMDGGRSLHAGKTKRVVLQARIEAPKRLRLPAKFRFPRK